LQFGAYASKKRFSPEILQADIHSMIAALRAEESRPTQLGDEIAVVEVFLDGRLALRFRQHGDDAFDVCLALFALQVVFQGFDDPNVQHGCQDQHAPDVHDCLLLSVEK
jgi:hypothetical protein